MFGHALHFRISSPNGRRFSNRKKVDKYTNLGDERFSVKPDASLYQTLPNPMKATHIIHPNPPNSVGRWIINWLICCPPLWDRIQQKSQVVTTVHGWQYKYTNPILCQFPKNSNSRRRFQGPRSRSQQTHARFSSLVVSYDLRFARTPGFA